MVNSINLADDNWTPRIGDNIWIDDFFYNGMVEFTIVGIANERHVECKHDSNVYWVDLNYYRPNIYVSSL